MTSRMGDPTPLPPTPLSPEHPAGGRIIVTALDARRAELRTLASNATRGLWEAVVLGSEGYDVRAPQGTVPGRHRLHRPRIARCGYEDWSVDRANAEYIAAACPEHLLQLLDSLDRVLALCDEWDALSKGETTTTRHIRAAIVLEPRSES